MTPILKYIKKLGEACYLGTVVLTIATVELVAYQQPVSSRNQYPIAPNSEDLICYMQTENGRVLNLESLCGRGRDRSPVKALSAKDRQFLAEYKKLLQGFPEAEATLSRLVEENPQAIASKAAEVCNELRTGVYSESRIANPDADAAILNYLAPEYYCPELQD